MVERKSDRPSRMSWWFASLIGLVIVAVLWQGYLFVRSVMKPDAPVIDGIHCDRVEQDALHIHSHLVLYVNGSPVSIPKGIGINEIEQCDYWLHTHDTTGIIHVESPVHKDFTLGNFFDIWNQLLGEHQVWNFSNAEPIRAYVNGKRFYGNPRTIVLRDRERIVLEVGPRFVPPLDPFVFPKDL